MAREVKRITVRLPARIYDELQRLVERGDFLSVEDAARTAIRKFVSERTGLKEVSGE